MKPITSTPVLARPDSVAQRWNITDAWSGSRLIEQDLTDTALFNLSLDGGSLEDIVSAESPNVVDDCLFYLRNYHTMERHGLVAMAAIPIVPAFSVTGVRLSAATLSHAAARAAIETELPFVASTLLPANWIAPISDLSSPVGLDRARRILHGTIPPDLVIQPSGTIHYLVFGLAEQYWRNGGLSVLQDGRFLEEVRRQIWLLSKEREEAVQPPRIFPGGLISEVVARNPVLESSIRLTRSIIEALALHEELPKVWLYVKRSELRFTMTVKMTSRFYSQEIVLSCDDEEVPESVGELLSILSSCGLDGIDTYVLPPAGKSRHVRRVGTTSRIDVDLLKYVIRRMEN